MNDLTDKHGPQRRTRAPDVSVVVPTRDRPDLCWDAVQSALCQRGVRTEVIVVDDGSRDPAILEQKFARDPRVRLYRSEVSVGVAAARNRGIAAASADWIALLDDDDLWAPDKLECQVRLALERQLSLVYTDIALVDRDRRLLKVVELPSPEGLRAAARRHNPVVGGMSSVLVRTELLRQVGGFDEQLQQLADWDLWLRLLGRAASGRCAQVLVARTEHAQNMQSATPHDLYQELHFLISKHSLARTATSDGVDMALFNAWVAAWHRKSGRRAEAARSYLRAVRRVRTVADLRRIGGLLLSDRGAARVRMMVRTLARRDERTCPPGTAWREFIARSRGADDGAKGVADDT